MSKRSVSLYQAQTELPALLQRASSGESIIISRGDGCCVQLSACNDTPVAANTTSREQRLLMLAMNADIEGDLKAAHLPVEMRIEQSIAKLQQHHCLSEEDACFAVEQWASALQLPRARIAEPATLPHPRPVLWDLFYPDHTVCFFGLAQDADEAIAAIDRRHGLMWAFTGSRTPHMPSPEPMDWDTAQQSIWHLNNQAYGGFQDWRIPTTRELYSLLSLHPETGHISPEFRVFQDLPQPLSPYYSAWSSTISRSERQPDEAAFVNLSRQYSGVTSVKHWRYVRPVRGPLQRKKVWPFPG